MREKQELNKPDIKPEDSHGILAKKAKLQSNIIHTAGWCIAQKNHRY